MATATNSTNRVAEYKSRKYRLLYIGPTKFGRRAKLGFFDGTKEFWVAAELVAEVAAGSSASHSSTSRQYRDDDYGSDNGWRHNGCSACRRLGDWCKQCAFDEFDN